MTLNANEGKKCACDQSVARLINPAQQEGKPDNNVHQINKRKFGDHVVMDGWI